MELSSYVNYSYVSVKKKFGISDSGNVSEPDYFDKIR